MRSSIDRRIPSQRERFGFIAAGSIAASGIIAIVIGYATSSADAMNKFSTAPAVGKFGIATFGVGAIGVLLVLVAPWRDAAALESVEVRIEKATDAMRLAAELVDELQAEMDARTATLARLQAENDQYERLAGVRKQEAETVTKLVETVINNAHANLGRVARRDQALFFFAGLLFSIPLQILLNAIS